MDLRLISRLLGIVAWLIGLTMAFSVPWVWPALGPAVEFESDGLLGLGISIAICVAVGALLRFWGRDAHGSLYRKEAMAVVGLSWFLATVLGALPFLLSGACRGRDAEGQPIPMTIADALFESQSGFSTTGATVLTAIEDAELVPRSLLFWRSSTHFLGGMGIIVLFVAILGQGSAGKALMRAEMPGPSAENSYSRMQQAAWSFAGLYFALNAILTALLWFEGMTVFDALCHAFGAMATGGFSTYDTSLGHFEKAGYAHAVAIDYTIVVFMILAGSNFAVLYGVFVHGPKSMFRDVEWRVYMATIVGVTAFVVGYGMFHRDFAHPGHADRWEELRDSTRFGLFQVVSIMTTTGFGTHDFNNWNSFGRGVLFLLMFVGGCAGSTGGGLKVIRHVLFLKALWLEIERAFHPSVVRPLRLGGKPVEDSELGHNVIVYFALILVIFVFSWLFIVAVEPDRTWIEGGHPRENKLIDAATSVAATLNNIGPGLGVVGATENYARFTSATKLLFTLLMMIGRLEIFVIVVLFVPGFWRSH
ncbi:MAG: TrkH family potassium uptake protein [Planctomycetales bacterium]|nr:TrkH family potassium uptake protein [Planctomycetales bacterium]